MKPIILVGIALIIVGAIALGYQGITYTTREKVVEIGPIEATKKTEKVRALTEELSAIHEVDTVESLTRGPTDTDEALKSPLWKRVLFSEDQKASFIYVWLKQRVPLEKGVHEIEEIKQRLDAPDFPLMISGAPYIIELIQRNLLHDLKVFSIAAFR